MHQHSGSIIVYLTISIIYFEKHVKPVTVAFGIMVEYKTHFSSTNIYLLPCITQDIYLTHGSVDFRSKIIYRKLNFNWEGNFGFLGSKLTIYTIAVVTML